MCGLGFYKEIEGLLGEEQEMPEALIVVREPNFSPKDENDRLRDFWFRNVVNGYEKNRRGAAYRDFYKTFVGKLFGTAEEARLSRLKQCAYMNLRPDAGSGTMSEEYKKVREEFKRSDKENLTEPDIAFHEICWNYTDEDKVMAKWVAANRMRVIQNAIKGKVPYIITTPDIYEALKGTEEKEYKLPRVKRPYYYCRSGETIIISLPHPSWILRKHYTQEELEALDQYEGNDLFKK